MTKLIVEVVNDEETANFRVEYYKARNCEIVHTERYSDVTWVNKTQGGNSDTAFDPLDNEVWVVIAKK